MIAFDSLSPWERVGERALGCSHRQLRPLPQPFSQSEKGEKTKINCQLMHDDRLVKRFLQFVGSDGRETR